MRFKANQEKTFVQHYGRKKKGSTFRIKSQSLGHQHK